MTTKNHPIGIFDSGLGGLTVFKAIRGLLPHEKLIYFGDTAHVPYGSKSAETVAAYSLAIARFLEGKNIKLLVVACNTACALALGKLRAKVKIPVIGVIEPGAKTAAALTKNRKIGVIGTEATVRSRAYFRAVRGFEPRAAVSERACPLFVPLVEEGWWNKRVTALVAEEYLSKFSGTGMDTLILGCTHYPVIKSVIQKAAGPKVRLVDSAQAAALDVRDCLAAGSLLRESGRAQTRIYASDDPARFKRLAANILGHPLRNVSLVRLD